MKGDFSSWRFGPSENVQGVLFQQGRVILDSDLTEVGLIELNARHLAGRDTLGAGIAAVPAEAGEGFRLIGASVSAGVVTVQVTPGRLWADGLPVTLPGSGPSVPRLAEWLPAPPNPPGDNAITAGTRDLVLLEAALEEVNGFQLQQRLLEPALGGPDTAERIALETSFRLLRLGPGEDCRGALGKLRDPAGTGRLTVALAPTTVIPGDCPVVEGGGYAGFEHNLYRIEVAAVADATARFKWSSCNGGLVGRGRFVAGPPKRVEITANRAAILTSGLTRCYLEALVRDADLGRWRVAYGAIATRNGDDDLELQDPPIFGTFAPGPDPVFFRIWNGIEAISGFTAPTELRDGILLDFDPPGPGATYLPGDHWIFDLRAGEIGNPEVLIDATRGRSPILARVPLAEITWGADGGAAIEDCRQRFRPLTAQRGCCTLLVGDGRTSFGDFNSLEEAAEHLPPAGGELCLLPGIHLANLVLRDKRAVRIHGCPRRTIVLARPGAPDAPPITLQDCREIAISDLDIIAFFGAAILGEGELRDITVRDCRMIARTAAIELDAVTRAAIAGNEIWLLDTDRGGAAIALRAEDTIVERNRVGVWPFELTRPERPPQGESPPDRTPDDPCAKPEELYKDLPLAIAYVSPIWTASLLLAPKQPYRAWGGIHLMGGCADVRLLENRVDGGAGHGVTLGGLLPGTAPPPAEEGPGTVPIATRGETLFGQVSVEGGPLPASVGLNLVAGGQVVATTRADGAQNGAFALKPPAGSYTLQAEPGWRILRVVEAGVVGAGRVIGVVLRAVPIVARLDAAPLERIGIEGNAIRRMALSGIGFRPHADLVPAPQPADPAEQLLAAIAPAELVRGCNILRDLDILHNRIEENLRAVATDALRAAAREVGQGGISLALVENGRIADNHLLDNGAASGVPACGIFIGHAEEVEISGNRIAGNGRAEADLPDALRGGIFVRLASAFLLGGEADARQKPALRISGNRVDQPVGRAITAFAYGPVLIAGNHLNSERSGRWGMWDRLAGAVLVFNLGGIDRQAAVPQPTGLATGSLTHATMGFGAAAANAPTLPGGEVLFEGNQLRLGPQHGSATSFLVWSYDAVGVTGNQSAVLRPDLLYTNGLVSGHSVIASGNRLREQTRLCFASMITEGNGINAAAQQAAMNTTSLNQGDHCIFVLCDGPLRLGTGNLELNTDICRRLGENQEGLRAAMAAALQHVLGAAQGGIVAAPGTIGLRANASLLRVGAASQAARLVDAAMLEQRLGPEHPRVQALRASVATRGAILGRLDAGVEAARIEPARPPAEGSLADGRVLDPAGRGRVALKVDLLGANGRPVATATTDEAGYWSVPMDAEATRRLGGQKLTLRVSDADGTVLQRSEGAVTLTPGAPARTDLVLRQAPLTPADITGGRVVFEGARTATEAVGGTESPLMRIRGIGADDAAKLREAGIVDAAALLRTPPERLKEITGTNLRFSRAEALRASGLSADPLRTRKP